MDFHIGKLGHIVLQVSDLEKSTAFYTQVLGPKSFRCLPRNDDAWRDGFPALQSGPSLPGAGRRRASDKPLTKSCITSPSKSRHSPKLSALVIACAPIMFKSILKDAAGPVARSPLNSAIRTTIRWKSTGASIKWAAMVGVRPQNEWHGVKSLEEAIAHPVPGQDTHLSEMSSRLSFSRGYNRRIFAQPGNRHRWWRRCCRRTGDGQISRILRSGICPRRTFLGAPGFRPAAGPAHAERSRECSRSASVRMDG